MKNAYYYIYSIYSFSCAKPRPPALGGGGTADRRWEVLVSSFINQLNRTFHHSAVLCRKIKFWARLKVNCNIKLNKRWSPFLPQAAGRRGFALQQLYYNWRKPRTWQLNSKVLIYAYRLNKVHPSKLLFRKIYPPYYRDG